jgi:hypothetical protein
METVYIVAQDHFAGNLAELARSSHVWVWLTEHNARAYREAVRSDPREYSPHYGLSGYEVRGDAIQSLYAYLGTFDQHHDASASDPPWQELRIIGIDASQLDANVVERELDCGRIKIEQADGAVVLSRAV